MKVGEPSSRDGDDEGKNGGGNRNRVSHPSARLAPDLVDDGGDDVEDLLLLTSRELLHFVEEAASLTGRSATPKGSVHIEEVLDAYAERVGKLSQHVGAGWLFGALPEGDVGLGLTDDTS